MPELRKYKTFFNMLTLVSKKDLTELSEHWLVVILSLAEQKGIIPAQKLHKQASVDLTFHHPITIHWVGPKEIQKLKRQHLHINEVTDILSFPTDPFFQAHGVYGDLVLCYSVLKKQAKEFGHPPACELLLLLVHGALHLFGFDHQTPSDRRAMQTLEQLWMNTILGPVSVKSLIHRAHL